MRPAGLSPKALGPRRPLGRGGPRRRQRIRLPGRHLRRRQGLISSDLYYRLNVVPIQVPPLRERAEDIPLLVHHFVQRFARRLHKVIDEVPTASLVALDRCHWPRNVRELAT